VHSDDLQALRAQSQATIEQLRSAQESTIAELKAQHESAIESQVKSLEKKLAGRDLELNATHEDLVKAKAALAASGPEMESLRTQLGNASKDAQQLASSAGADQAAHIERLNRELAASRDDLAAITEVLQVTKESISEMSRSHGRELEEGAQSRVEEVSKLRATHADDLATFAQEKSSLLAQLSDLQGELATLKAATDAGHAAAPKTNGNAAHGDTGVSKEELQRLHEAHNLKIHDLKSDHDKALQALREELESALQKTDDKSQEVARKAMEVQFLEQEQDELNDELARYADPVHRPGASC
jgi:chromosome segregation ATPase